MGGSASGSPVLTKSTASGDYSLPDRKNGGNSGGNFRAQFGRSPRKIGNLHEFSVASLATITLKCFAIAEPPNQVADTP